MSNFSKQVSLIMAELDDHTHCSLCIKRICDDGCPMVSCDLNCGATYHWCKTSEHESLCLNTRVPCLNASNGCPMSVPRYQLGSHLAHCPASVICCNCEWNRWPLHCQERNGIISRKNFHAKPGQLDVLLALRDQKHLNQMRKLPLSMQRVLRDDINRSFPKISIGSGSVDHQVQYNEKPAAESHFAAFTDCDEFDYSHEPEPAGLQKSVWTKLFGNVHSDDKHFTSDELKDENSVINAQNITEHNDEFEKIYPDLIPSAPSINIPHMLSLDLNVESITRYQVKPHSMYTFMCAELFRRDEYPWHVRNIHSEIQSGLNGWLEQRCPLSWMGCQFSVRRMYPNNPDSKIVYNPILESFGLQPHVEKRLLKPNISKDDLEIIHCEEKSDFTDIKDNSTEREERGQRTYQLLDLPIEILELIALNLDGFSLNNLAMTCHALREVCQDVLPDKGIVTMKWSCQAINGKKHWYIADFLWLFSDATSEITSWGLDPQVFSVTEHLKKCAFNDRLIRTERCQVMITGEELEFRCSESGYEFSKIGFDSILNYVYCL